MTAFFTAILFGFAVAVPLHALFTYCVSVKLAWLPVVVAPPIATWLAWEWICATSYCNSTSAVALYFLAIFTFGAAMIAGVPFILWRHRRDEERK